MMRWSHAGTIWPVGTDDRGEGAPVLLLPALSSISTRAELAPLAAALGPGLRTIAVDWPGFGVADAPGTPLAAGLLRAFLADVLAGLAPTTGGRPPAVVAAGHAAGYALDHAARHPGAFGRLALVAPTWRGPLPTMMGGPRPMQARVRALVEAPVIGPLLYALNLSRPVVRAMVKEHVLASPAALTPAYLAAKAPVIARRNARFATAAFVTGALDPFASRDAFLGAVRVVRAPILMVFGISGPRKSLAEMEALAGLPGVRAVRLPEGRLGVHEEHPAAVAAAIAPFLRDI